jgi:hypothetical protein
LQLSGYFLALISRNILSILLLSPLFSYFHFGIPLLFALLTIMQAVSTEQGKGIADELGIKFFEVSSDKNLNVETPFVALATDIVRSLPPPEPAQVLSTPILSDTQSF